MKKSSEAHDKSLWFRIPSVQNLKETSNLILEVKLASRVEGMFVIMCMYCGTDVMSTVFK